MDNGIEHYKSVAFKKVKEPRMLLDPIAQYKITYNKDGQHSQSQLCVLIDVPTQQQLDDFRPIKVFVTPEGCKHLPANTNNAKDLIECGWMERSISTCLE